MQFAEVITRFDEQILQEIILIGRLSFPSDWQEEDDEQYNREMMKDTNNIFILLKEDAKIIGYLLALPQSKAVEELKADDPFMQEDRQRYYVETMSILPEFRKGRGFLRMLSRLIEESMRRGCNKVSMHARVNNGLSQVMQKYYKDMVTLVRRIENWKYYNGAEPTDYIEGTYTNSPKISQKATPE